MATEAKARILINDLLRRSGWRFFDDENVRANVTLETHVKLKKKTIDDLGDPVVVDARTKITTELLADDWYSIMMDYTGLDDWRNVIPEYVKDYVHLNKFM